MTRRQITRATGALFAAALILGAGACGDDDAVDDESPDVVDGMGGTDDEGSGLDPGDGLGGTEDDGDLGGTDGD